MTLSDPLFTTFAEKLLEVDADPRLPWHDDPAGFARECIEWPDGTELAMYQAEILSALAQDHRVAVRSLRGAGKTATAALSVLWFAITRDQAGIPWKCLTTAGSHGQLERVLWPEVHLWSRRIRWDVVGRRAFDRRRELFTSMLRLDHGEAFSAASDNPALLEGAHATSMFVLIDEAKSVETAVYDSIEGSLDGRGESFVLATSTPGAPTGRFYDIHIRRPGLENWRAIHVSLPQAIAAGQRTQAWADQQAALWGPTSGLYLNHVEGQFAADDEEGVIPLSWVMDAVERWRALHNAGDIYVSAPPVIGIDVGGGRDHTVIVRRRAHVVELIGRWNTPEAMDVVGRAFPYSHEPGALTVIDATGIGAGAASRLRELSCSVDPFQGGSGSHRKDRTGARGFKNRRAEVCWNLRQVLDPTFGPSLALPDDDELIGDLTAPRYFYNSNGNIQIEAKDDIRRRLGRSPDTGDAVVQACCGFHGDQAWVREGRRAPERFVPSPDAQDWSHLGVSMARNGMDWSTSGQRYPDDFYFEGTR